MRNEIISRTTMWKANIRKEMMRMRDELPKDDVDTLSKQCRERLLAIPFLNQCDAIFLYASHRNEVDTKPLLDMLKKLGKTLAYPKVMDTAKKKMEFFRIHGEEDLAIGYQGILEPKIANSQPVQPNHSNCTAILLPGLAFSKDGERIGYGGGYYDNYLNYYRECNIIKIAFAYEFQIMNELPVLDYDVKMDGIVTNETYYRCSEKL